MVSSNDFVIINGGTASQSKTLPTTRVQISPDSSRGIDWSYTTGKEFKLYYDGDDSSFATFDDVFYELMIYKPRNKKKTLSGYKRTYKGFIHPATQDCATKHQGSSTHNGTPIKGITEWSVVNGVYEKTPITIDLSNFFKNRNGSPINFPLLETQTTIKQPPRLDYYLPSVGGRRKARKLVIAFRLCGMKQRAGGGYDYTYGDMSDKVAVYPELRKNRGEVSVDAFGSTVNMGDLYYCGISANFADISTHSDFF